MFLAIRHSLEVGLLLNGNMKKTSGEKERGIDLKLIGITKDWSEMGRLTHQKRTGWWRRRVRDPEAVAEHSQRAALIGYVLASLEEGVNPERVAVLCLFHEVQETRTGDLNGMNQRYAKAKEGEYQALREQAAPLPQQVAQKVLVLAEEENSRSPRESRLAKEADMLECFLQCREYHIQGETKAPLWAEMCDDRSVLLTSTEESNACEKRRHGSTVEQAMGEKNDANAHGNGKHKAGSKKTSPPPWE